MVGEAKNALAVIDVVDLEMIVGVDAVKNIGNVDIDGDIVVRDEHVFFAEIEIAEIAGMILARRMMALS